MPSTRKQEKARKSRVTEMLSDIENLDIMLRGNHLEREGIEFSGSIRRPDSPNFNAPENIEEDMYPNCREKRSSKSAHYGHISAGTDSSAEFSRF